MGYFKKAQTETANNYDLDKMIRISIADVIGTEIPIYDYFFINGKFGKCVVLVLTDKNSFIFGTDAITDKFVRAEEEIGSHIGVLEQIEEDEVTLYFDKFISKKGNEYISINFVSH